MGREKLQELFTTKDTKVHKGKEKDAHPRVLCWEKEFLDLIIFALEQSQNKCTNTDKAHIWK